MPQVYSIGQSLTYFKLLRFNTSKRRPVRNYFSRREQWRLLLLVMSLGVVIIAMREVRRPDNVARLTQVFADQAAPSEATGRREAASPSAPQISSGSAPDAAEFRPATSKDASASGLGPQDVRVEALETVRDNTYFRIAEKDVWFRLWSLVQKTSQNQINSGSAGEVNYVQLVDQPRTYRAKLVTVHGTVRQVSQQTPATNDLGLAAYYRVVVQPSDGNPSPIFVYCLELPAELRVGENMTVDITVTGYFFKNLSYRWRDGLGIAPVILAKSVSRAEAVTESSSSLPPSRAPVETDAWRVPDVESAPQASAAGPELRELLSLAGWDAARFAQFADDQPLTDDERKQLIELLWRFRTFDAASIDAWTQSGLAFQELIDNSVEHRGEMLRVAGRVTSIQRYDLSPEDEARLEMPAYYACRLETANGGDIATVITPRVPKAWQQLATLNEPASVSALFVKRLPAEQGAPTALFAAKQIAWHPTTTKDNAVSFGQSILGTLGMDVGQLDDIGSRGPIRSTEREAFYQMLDAAGRIGPNQLVRFAHGNVKSVRKHWTHKLETADDDPHRALAQEVLRRAEQGQYSVAPLFNEPERHLGELVVIDGVVRRAVRVDVGLRPDGSAPSDIARRFGINDYYELEVFTDDSQNYPLVFCVRELPVGFPTVGELHVPVRVAGFLFKNWLYTTRGTVNDGRGNARATEFRSQYAPLLIGRSPLLLPEEQGVEAAQLVGGGLFLLALAGIWVAAWWLARGDRQFADRIRNTHSSLPVGQSLNELNLPVVDQPMIYPEVAKAETVNPS